MLRPGVPHVSENIRVRSIVGRFLEHSRIFYFLNGGKEEVYIGSADLMFRNLSRRVEVLTPIKDATLRAVLKDTVLAYYLKDNVNARELRTDGTYFRVKPVDGDKRFDAQIEFETTEFSPEKRPDGKGVQSIKAKPKKLDELAATSTSV